MGSIGYSDINPGLDRVKKLCHRLGDPQDKINIIHIAGTNAKGSVGAFLTSVFSHMNKRAGWFSSPALFDKRENIRVISGCEHGDGLLSDDKYYNYKSYIDKIADQMAIDGLESTSEFERETAMAFYVFYKEHTDIAVVEAGMGGSYDATNVIKNPLACVITPISYDHTHYLGDSIEDIVCHKAGIIKDGSHVITYQTDKILPILSKKADDNNGKLKTVSDDDIKYIKSDIYGSIFRYKDIEYSIKMSGIYQVKNAALAIETLYTLYNIYADMIPDDIKDNDKENILINHIKKGIYDAFIPGRFQVLSKDPVIIYDGAHNPDGAKALSESINYLLKDKKIYAVMGVYRDKDYHKMIKILAPYFYRIICVKAYEDRALPPDELADAYREYMDKDMYIESCDDIHNAIEKYKNDIAKDDGDGVIVICGSLSLLSGI